MDLNLNLNSRACNVRVVLCALYPVCNCNLN